MLKLCGHRATWENSQWLNVLPCLNILEMERWIYISANTRVHFLYGCEMVTDVSYNPNIMLDISIFLSHAKDSGMESEDSTTQRVIVRRAGLLWSQQDFECRWSVPLFKCLTVLEFSFILFDLCLLITFFNFIMNHVPIVTFWIFTYHKIWILSIMFCFIWSYWIIYFLACLEVSWRVVS